MALQCGIIGLPNVGKSTLFNALTASNTPAENYPFCTIEPHVGIVELPDQRLQELGKIYNPKKIIPATIEFTDIAGLVRGASKGEGLGNKFLGQIRQTASIIHVVRCFEDGNITHVDGDINPIRDAETIGTELLLADLETLEKRYQKTEKKVKTGDRVSKKELDLINRLLIQCNNGYPARTLSINQDEKEIFHSLHLLTSKPILYVANVSEQNIMHIKKNKHVQALTEFAEEEGNSAICICASIEQEIAVLPDEEKAQFLKEYQLPEPGLNKVIRAGFQLLELHTFFTCGEKQVRAWTIPVGATAPIAAGEIHTDFERGFIKAEVFYYGDMIKHKSEKILSDLGLIRQEGKKYVVQDGDCIYFKFNI